MMITMMMLTIQQKLVEQNRKYLQHLALPINNQHQLH